MNYEEEVEDVQKIARRERYIQQLIEKGFDSPKQKEEEFIKENINQNQVVEFEKIKSPTLPGFHPSNANIYMKNKSLAARSNNNSNNNSRDNNSKSFESAIHNMNVYTDPLLSSLNSLPIKSPKMIKVLGGLGSPSNEKVYIDEDKLREKDLELKEKYNAQRKF